MRFTGVILSSLMFLSALPGGGLAQICAGSPALGTNSSGNVGLGVSFFDGGKQFGGGATFGRTLYGSAGFTYTDFDDTTLSLKTVAAGVGYEVAPQASTVSVCPNISVGYGFGLEFLGIDITTLSILPAVAVGLMADVSPAIAVIPFAEVALAYTRTSADAGPLGEESESDTSGLLILGAGFLFNARLSIGPSVAIPISEDGGDTVFGVGLSVALGGSS